MNTNDRVITTRMEDEKSEVIKAFASYIEEQYYALYHIWLEDHTYICLQEKQKGVLSEIGEEGIFEPAWEQYSRNYIADEDMESMCEFANLSTLAERLRNINSVSHIYRRKKEGWTRGTFFAGERDEAGNVINVIYTVTDINTEIENKNKQERAVYEAEHDALTGVYNRKGLENYLASEKNKNGKVGFAIIDIDNFKTINDNFGHAVGDQILVATADLMSSVIYTGDVIARIGGDEFAILFNNSGVDAWDDICLKIRAVHASLASLFSKTMELSVTISCGLCFSDNGYSKIMYQLADEALYETKKRGRAGCSLINRNHHILKHWKDETLSIFARNVLTYNNTGICQIEIPLNEEKPRRVICGDDAKLLFGIPKETSPEGCYRIFKEGIDAAYRDELIRAEKSMIEFGQTECTFLWHHPDFGEMLIRCGGFGEKKNDRIVLSGYCHTLKDTNIIEKQNDQAMILKAMNETYVASYYLDLENDMSTAFKIAPGEDYMMPDVESLQEMTASFISVIVDPRDRDMMREFMDKTTLQYRLGGNSFTDAEYRSLMLGCWCRARLIPVRYNSDGNLTHVLFNITALDSGEFSRTYSIDYNRRSLAALFNHVPCGIVMFEWNGDSLNTVHISRYYETVSGHLFVKTDERNRKRLNFDCIHPDDVKAYQKAIINALEKTHELHHEYRAWSELAEDYIWERVDAIVSSQSDDVQLIYAVYTDVTEQKNQELRLEKNQQSLLAALKDYDNRLHSLASITENTFFMCIISVTENTYEILEGNDTLRKIIGDSHNLEEFLLNSSECVVDQNSGKEFRRIFNRENLLREAADGNMHIQFESIIKLGEKQYEWITSAIDMVNNPVTGEITGAAYMKSMQTEKMNLLLLGKTLEQDYLFAAAIFVDTDEFYLYNSRRGKFSERRQNYWEVALKNVQTHCSEATLRSLEQSFVKKKIIDYLENNSEFSFAFDSILNGEEIRLEIRFCYLDENRTMLLASMRNITDISLLEQYRHDSEHDSLTDLYNRETLFRRCRKLLNTYPDENFVMVHIDVKHFQLYNTFFGDEAGDQLLCNIANILRKVDEDYEYWAYGRIEADVFAAFFPYNEEKYQGHVTQILQNLKKIRSEFLVEPKLGLYFVTDPDMSIESMFVRATVAARNVHHDTPYATVVFDDEMEKTLMDNQQITNEMQSAADSEQFKVYLQPKYSLRTGQAVGAEALVRWIHPERGLITPNRFIPLFESNGFISTLDRYMWEHTCRILHRWKKEGRPMMPISVNVSRISIYSQDTVDFLKGLIKKYDIDPKYLELELTESAYVESPEEIRPRLEELKKYGFVILMDDFGSGYSSLNTLKDLPVDVLKLDMKFLASSRGSKRADMVIVSIIRMSKLLNLSVIAEGVEQQEQADYLCSIGCEYAQGFLYERPIPVADFEERILTQSVAGRKIKDICTENVSEVLNNSPEMSGIFGGILPDPVMVIEYSNRYFACMRVNDALMSEFGLDNDLRPAHLLFEEHLSDSDYDRMMRAYDRCVDTKEPLSFRIVWRSGGENTGYLARVSYTGNMGAEHMLTVIFTDETPKNYLE